MPSSGYGSISLGLDTPETQVNARHLIKCAKCAMANNLFIEWLESFLAAWGDTGDVVIASNAGLEEWDL